METDEEVTAVITAELALVAAIEAFLLGTNEAEEIASELIAEWQS